MLTVYKYPVGPAGDYFEMELPIEARILKVDMQRGALVLWALVNPDSAKETRVFRWAGTGHLIKESPRSLEYVNTFFACDGDLVFHVFEVLKDQG